MISMNRTYTPELTPEVLDRLGDYAALFRDDFRTRPSPPGAASTSTACSTTASARASSRCSRRVPLPAELLDVQTPTRPSSSSSTRAPGTSRPSAKRYRSRDGRDLRQPRGDLRHRRHHLPQAGQALRRRPAAVLRALGKKANCQVAVSVHYVSPKGHYPLAMRLYLPESWLSDAERLDKAGVPEEDRAGADQGADRPGVARPGPRRGAARPAWSWPTPATASRGRSATAWPSAGCTTSSA